MMYEDTGRSPVTGRRLHWLWQPDSDRAPRYETVFASRELREKVGIGIVTARESLPVRAIQTARTPPSESNNDEAGRRDSVAAQIYSVDVPPLSVISDLPLLLRRELEWTLDQADLTSDSDFAYWNLIPERLQRDLLRSAVSSFLVVVPDEDRHSSIDRVSEHINSETAIRRNDPDLTTNTSNQQYSGPLFVYTVFRAHQNGERLVERRAPINIVWLTDNDDRPTPVDCGTVLQQANWTGADHPLPVPVPQTHSHVIVDGGGGPRYSGFDESVTQPSSGLPFSQWHCRFFNIPAAMDKHSSVAGSAHHDPLDHGQLRRHFFDANSNETNPLIRVIETVADLLPSQFSGADVHELSADLLTPDWRRNEAREKVHTTSPVHVVNRVTVNDLDEFDPDFDGKITRVHTA